MVSSTAQRIAGIAEQARSALLDTDTAIEQLAAAAQARGGLTGRRLDGAFFTDPDVALHLARRAIFAALLDASDADADIDDLLAAGHDLRGVLVETVADASSRAAMVRRLDSLQVLDPTCGAGSFMIAAWTVLVDAAALLDAPPPRLDQLCGVDLDGDAVAACRASLAIVARGASGAARVLVADAEHAGSLPAADVVLGNPPFVRATATVQHRDLATRRVPNRSAWIVERALACARPGARIGFVLPISTACTDAFAPARATWQRACDRVHATHFDTIPSSLFRDVVQRVSLFEGRARTGAGDTDTQWWTSRYHRWLGQERATLLAGIRHVPLPRQTVRGSIAKIGTDLEAQLLERIFTHPPAGRLFRAPDEDPASTPNRIYYKRRWSYFLLFTDFVPGIWSEDGAPRQPSELKCLDVTPELDARALLAVFSSTLFWWYFSVFTDNRNVNRRDLAAFPLPDLEPESEARLARLGSELMAALHACAEVRTCTYRSVGTIRNTYFRQGATRPVLDRIDRELALAYGMTDAQLEFVLGFEHRFRSEEPVSRAAAR